MSVAIAFIIRGGILKTNHLAATVILHVHTQTSSSFFSPCLLFCGTSLIYDDIMVCDFCPSVLLFFPVRLTWVSELHHTCGSSHQLFWISVLGCYSSCQLPDCSPPPPVPAVILSHHHLLKFWKTLFGSLANSLLCLSRPSARTSVQPT